MIREARTQDLGECALENMDHGVQCSIEPRSRQKGTSKLRIEPVHNLSCYLQNACRQRDTKLCIAVIQNIYQ